MKSTAQRIPGYYEWIPQTPTLQDGNKVNILVVDDLPQNRMVYGSILEELDQNLFVVHSGEEALKLVLKHEFAVILLDVNMQGMDGFETAALIRQRKKSARTPIIFLTAFADELRIAQGYASGAVDYLPTPVVPQVLQAKVKVFIEMFQMRRQAALQAEERALRRAAEEADRRKDEFLGMLAHELRNPLGPIQNAVQLLHMMGPQESRAQRLHDIIERQVKHMSHLIDDLLDATRLAHGKILLQKETCDLSRIVRQTVEDYRSIIEEKGLHLEMDVPQTPLWVNGDPTRLVQAVGNLLHNAHKFNNTNGSIRVELKGDGRNHACLKVTDTGIGLESHMLSCIFDVFRQADQDLDRSRGGLGLGLALVKGLIELHGGSVQAESDGPDRGSQFTVRLPTTSQEKIAPELPQIACIGEGEKCRILLIEDNRDSAESTQMLLNLEGYDVRMVHNGQAGLETVRSFQPRIVLCDIGLPGMDGYQVARQIRQEAADLPVYVIALTGYGREQDQQLAYEAGFDLHLTKPVDYHHLRQAIINMPAHRCL